MRKIRHYLLSALLVEVYSCKLIGGRHSFDRRSGLVVIWVGQKTNVINFSTAKRHFAIAIPREYHRA